MTADKKTTNATTTKLNLNVDVHHLTRVEGHGNIRVRVVNGELTEARWDVVETPRFFEGVADGFRVGVLEAFELGEGGQVGDVLEDEGDVADWWDVVGHGPKCIPPPAGLESGVGGLGTGVWL